MGVNGEAAIATMTAFKTWRAGYCLEAVWQAYKRNGARTNLPAPTAYDGWLGSSGKHPGDRNPPRGVPVYFGPKSSSRAGDVVISLGGGQVLATDWPRNGVIGITTIDARQRQIGRPYLGWTDTILNHPIDLPGAGAPTEGASKPAEPEPEPKEKDDMKIIGNSEGAQKFADEFGADDIGQYFFVPNGADGNPSWSDNVRAAWLLAGEPEQGRKGAWDMELARHIADARWNHKRGQIVTDVVNSLRPFLQELGAAIAGISPERFEQVIEEGLKNVVVEVAPLDEETLADMAKANADEVDRRDRERLAIGSEPSA